MKRPVAVVGVGQTQAQRRGAPTSASPAWCARRSTARSLDAGLEHKDIDADRHRQGARHARGRRCSPSSSSPAPIGAHMKPMMRVHTAGSVGASTALTAVTHVASGLFERVLTIAFEKQSEGNAMWALSPNMPFTPPLVAGAGGFFAPYCRAYITRTGCPPHIGPMIAANARDNAAPQRVRAPARADDASRT